MLDFLRLFVLELWTRKGQTDGRTDGRAAIRNEACVVEGGGRL